MAEAGDKWMTPRWGRALNTIGNSGYRVELFGADSAMPCRFALIDPQTRDCHAVVKFYGSGEMEPRVGLTDEHALQMVEERLLVDLAESPLCDGTGMALDSVRAAIQALVARGRRR